MIAAQSPPPPPPSPAEIDGRMAELEAQRVMAQNRCVYLAGRMAELLDLLKLSEAENKQLKELVNSRDGIEPAAPAGAAPPAS